jgi:chemotaxis protein CheC
MTAATSSMLTELELDALTELVNLGVSNAALSLREMVREEVFLTVPNVALVTRAQALVNLGENKARRLVAVRQDFEGDIVGRALLIFPEARSMELVRALVGGELSLEEIMELEQEALAETGNVLLNGCLGTVANSLQTTLRISLPEVVHGEGAEFFDVSHAREGDGVLFIYINFTVKLRDISGYIAMLLDLPSLVTLKELLGTFITRTTGVSTAPAHDAK